MNAFLKLHRVSQCWDTRLADWGGSLLLLTIRLHVGWQFFKAGLLKVQDWDSTLALFHDEYQVPLLPPDLAALLGAGGELLLPALLFLGLFTRPAAMGLFLVNLMAVAAYPALFQFECPAALNNHFFWGILLLVGVAFGSGRLAVDPWLARRAKLD